MWNSNFTVYRQSLIKTQPPSLVCVTYGCFSAAVAKWNGCKGHRTACEAWASCHLALYRKFTDITLVVWKLHALFCSYNGHFLKFFHLFISDKHLNLYNSINTEVMNNPPQANKSMLPCWPSSKTYRNIHSPPVAVTSTNTFLTLRRNTFN